MAVIGGALPVLSPSVPVDAQTAPVADTVPTVMLVVDTSGSMADADTTGGAKIEGARAALIQFLAGIEPETRVGLHTYPDLDQGDCSSGETQIGIDQRDPSRMDAIIRTLTPDGDTPTAEALTQAAQVLADAGATTASIVLVSDGESTCEDPCLAADTIEATGVDIQVIAVGLAVSPEAVDELTCIAEATDGVYVDANDTDALNDILADLSRAAVSVDLDYPEEVVAEVGLDDAGRVSITARIGNPSRLAAREVQVRIRFEGGTAAVTSPIRAIGNLEPGAAREVTWDFRPGLALVNNDLGEGSVAFEVIASGPNLAADIGRRGLIRVVDATSREDAGPILAEAERIAILGDSFSSGEGGEDYVSGSDVRGNRCHQSANTYLAEQFDIPDELILACSGARTVDITEPDFGNGQQAQAEQLRQVQDDGGPVDLVVMTLGGNNVGFASILESCLLNPLGACNEKIWFADADDYVRTRLNTTFIDLISSYRAINQVLNSPEAKQERGGSAPIVVLGYPRILPGSAAPFGIDGANPCLSIQPFEQGELDFGSQLITDLNGVVEGAVRRSDQLGVPIAYVPLTEDAFLPNHTLCDGNRAYVRSAETIDFGATVGNLATLIADGRRGILRVRDLLAAEDQLSRFAELFHPNENGYDALTRGLVRWSLTPEAAEVAAQESTDRQAESTPVPVSTAGADERDGSIDLSADGSQAVRTGGYYDVEVSGLQPGSTVELTLASDLRIVAAAVADEGGEAAMVFAVPSDLPEGEHTLTVLGTDEDGGERNQSVALDVSDGHFEWPVLPILGGVLLLFFVIGAFLLRSRRGARREPPKPEPTQDDPPPKLPPPGSPAPAERLTVTLD